jgi:nitroreductase
MQRLWTTQKPVGHVTEMTGHVPEFGGHDAETAGHDDPKYALIEGTDAEAAPKQPVGPGRPAGADAPVDQLSGSPEPSVIRPPDLASISSFSRAAATSWEARYGEPSPPAFPDEQFSQMLSQMMRHRSVRDYADKPVSEEALICAIAAAQSASTSSNLQPWSVIAVRDRDKQRRLAKLAGDQQQVADAPLFLAWVVDWSRLRRLGLAQNIPTDGIDYLESFTIGAVDTALAAQNAAIAFEQLGMGIVYIGGMRNYPEVVAAEFGLPAGSFVLFGMCVGYPDPNRPADVKPRLPQSAVLHHNRYDTSHEATSIADYDLRMGAFQRFQRRDDRVWSHVAVERMRGPQALTGRERLREAVNNLGLKLK